MRKLLNKPWFVALAATIAVLLVGHSLWSANRGGVTSSGPVAAMADEGSEPGTIDLDKWTVRNALKALPLVAVARDPFAVRTRADAENEKAIEADLVDRLHLSAIWTQDRTILVMINDRICQPGDEIGRLKIESITHDGVWLTHWKGRDFLTLGGDFTLNTPARTAHVRGLTL